MLKILVAGKKTFCDQIKNKIEDVKNEVTFAYTDELEEASIIISEEDCVSPIPSTIAYIETMKDKQTGKLSVAQTTLGKRVEPFPLENLPYILQSTMSLVELVLEKEQKVTEIINRNERLLESKECMESNLKNFQIVQSNVSNEMKDLDGFETVLYYLPKDAVSGDFLVTRQIYDGRTFLFFGDVTGHGFYAGAYAAILVALTKSYFDTCSVLGLDLQQLALYLAKAAFYYHGGNEQSSAECVICEIDPKKNLARFLTFSGGNISPILIKKDGSVQTVYALLEETSEDAKEKNQDLIQKVKPRLGEPFFEDNITFDSIPGIFEKRFCVGDTLLFYTDGISEMFSQTKEGKKDQKFVYGVENMERAVKDAVSLKGNSPKIIVDAIKGDVASFGIKELCESKNLKNLIYDDVTMFCMKRER